MAIGILHDDNGAAMFDFILVERILVIHRNLYVFTEETHIVLSEVFMFVIVLLLEELLLELVGPDPGEKLHLELAALVDHILEVEFYLLDYVFGVRL